ncbi:MAG: LemA family protein [Desulfobacteraceae bacterium]|nr:LemA family protein [Desulfobacteraceae bacterium]
MEPIIIFCVFFLIVLIGWFIQTYNRFIKYKNRIEETWSGIDVMLKRRFNLIPNLIKSIEGYSEHETKVLLAITDKRMGSNAMSDRVEEENRISKSLQNVMVLAEAYPDLKASTNFLALQNNLNDIEEDLQNVRNRYNRSVNQFNTLIESFPAFLIARKFGFTKRSYFSLDLATQRELPEVKFSNR